MDMNVIIKMIIFGEESLGKIDETLGPDYDEQKDRFNKLIKMFIKPIKNNFDLKKITKENVNISVDNFLGYLKTGDLATRYIFGEDIPLNDLQNEINKNYINLLETRNFNDYEDVFAEIGDSQKSIEINDFKLGTYKEFPELLEKDLINGYISEDVYNKYKELLNKSNSSEISKTMTLAKAGMGRAVENMGKEVNLGFIEPILLSLVVSAVGLLYVGYLYLVI